MNENESVVVALCLGRNGRADDWKHYLPTDSRVVDEFLEPISIVSKLIRSQPSEDSESPAKVEAGEEVFWGYRDAVVDAFTRLWPQVLQALNGLGSDTVHLVHFSAPATDEDLYSLWPYMPFGFRDDRRFFVSEVCKDSHTRHPSGWLCVEYAYDAFKRMTDPGGFGFRYGTTIMGATVTKSKADEFLRMDFLDKEVLEKALGSNDLRCWWFCDTDFEGMTIWHKDVSGPDLLDQLCSIVHGK